MYLTVLLTVKTSDEVRDQLDFLQNKLDCCLVIDGESLEVPVFSHTFHFTISSYDRFASLCSRTSLLKLLQSSRLWSLVGVPRLKRLMSHGLSVVIPKNACVALAMAEMTLV
jgi:hypothetical protein